MEDYPAFLETGRQGHRMPKAECLKITSPQPSELDVLDGSIITLERDLK
jgi:hypothetical protein